MRLKKVGYRVCVLMCSQIRTKPVVAELRACMFAWVRHLVMSEPVFVWCLSLIWPIKWELRCSVHYVACAKVNPVGNMIHSLSITV